MPAATLYYNHVPEPVLIPADGVTLSGVLTVAPETHGVVLFAHGSGSSRFSPRNKQVATALVTAGFDTLLFDLLDPEEAEDRKRVFDIGLLASRLEAATFWVRQRPAQANLGVGYFGASTGAAAALVAAAALGPGIRAVVSRGGRPDLAGASLKHVTAPTLLIVGERDEQVIELNAAAMRQMPGLRELAIVPGASHLFEEPGTLEEAARLAVGWFGRHLSGVPVAV